MSSSRFALPRPLLALGVLLQLAGCARSEEILVPVFLEAVIMEGQSQTDTVLATLDKPLRVQVRDQHGEPYAGIKILWELPTLGHGTLSAMESTTGTDGTAAVRLTLSPSAGTHLVHARVAGTSGQPLVFEATARPGRPTTLVRVRGGGGWTQAGQEVEYPYAVRVTDSYGNPSPGATVQWHVTAGSGQVEVLGPITSGTDFEVSHRLGPEFGLQTVVATGAGFPDGSQVAFSVTAVATVVHAVLPDPYYCVIFEEDCAPRFIPQDVVIPAGGVVAWTIFSGIEGCDVTFEDNPGPPASGRFASGGVDHLRSFPAPGLYRYQCTTRATDFTNGMVGTVTVQAASPDP